MPCLQAGQGLWLLDADYGTSGMDSPLQRRPGGRVSGNQTLRNSLTGRGFVRLFSTPSKAAYREEMFPKQCAAAYELGKNLLV